ncbi:hypothetical protein FNF27_00806 [Cafeteria roenbergensis]|uniref:Protein kinase domain-containing protein n=1 Tax=Cafeteria roenbergensis TaxID=33653 RepID=A0A5A8EI46_CAFRO|nr:hypothetical protein FNF31_04068 [Cafeteria roenbergensis]KAA0164544.1 hypothetical protein FNF28_03783 [Cafeteria roenbergensis]KAA0177633.1 hypothetical protein FNF27_00806 [Cafeteria roenbergensis]
MSVPAAVTCATKDLLTPATAYQFRVRAAIASGAARGPDEDQFPCGPWSEPSPPILTSAAPPPPPAGLVVSNAASESVRSASKEQPRQALLQGQREPGASAVHVQWRMPQHDNGARVTGFCLASCFDLRDWYALSSGDPAEVHVVVWMVSALGRGQPAAAAWVAEAEETSAFVHRVRQLGGVRDGSAASGSSPSSGSASARGADEVAKVMAELHRQSGRAGDGAEGKAACSGAGVWTPGEPDGSGWKPRSRTLGGTLSGAEALCRELEVREGEVRWDEPRVFVGSGGFGDVYRTAVGGYRGITAAVKVLRPGGEDGTASAEEQADDLLMEVAIIAPLRHRSLVQVLGFSLRLPRPFVVTEFAACGSLAAAIHGRTRPASRWTLKAKLQLALAVATGLAHLHSRSPPIVHRDVKPDNILLFGDPSLLDAPKALDSTQRLRELAEPSLDARIADFGLARVRRGSALRVRAAGTFDYCAPEAFRQGRPVDDRVDVYALAVTLHELLGESPPWGNGVLFEGILLDVALRAKRPDPRAVLRSTRGESVVPGIDRIALPRQSRPQRAGPAARPSSASKPRSRESLLSRQGDSLTSVLSAGDRPDGGDALSLRMRIEMELAKLLAEMWRPVPRARPSMAAVCSALEGILALADAWAAAKAAGAG